MLLPHFFLTLPNASEGEIYSYWAQFTNMLISLAVILTLVLVTVWFLKKMMRSRIKHLNRSTAIKVMERRALGPKSALYLVDVLGKGIVISESMAGIQCLTEFPPDTNISLLLDQLEEECTIQPSFKDVLSKTLKKLTSRNA